MIKPSIVLQGSLPTFSPSRFAYLSIEPSLPNLSLLLLGSNSYWFPQETLATLGDCCCWHACPTEINRITRDVLILTFFLVGCCFHIFHLAFPGSFFFDAFGTLRFPTPTPHHSRVCNVNLQIWEPILYMALPLLPLFFFIITFIILTCVTLAHGWPTHICSSVIKCK